MGDTAGFTPAQAPKVPAGRVRKKHSAHSLEGGGERESGGHSQENFWKLEQNHCDCKEFLVLEVNELKQLKICLKFISVTFKIMCDVITLVTWNELDLCSQPAQQTSKVHLLPDKTQQ